MNDGLALVRALLERESELADLLGVAWKAVKKQLGNLLGQLERDPQSDQARGELDKLVEELMHGPASALVRRVLRAKSAANAANRADFVNVPVFFGTSRKPTGSSAVDTSLLGHSYYGDNRSIPSDIHALVRGGGAPRFGMKPGGTTKRRFWVLKP